MPPRSLRGRGVSAALVAMTFLWLAPASWAASPGDRALRYFAAARPGGWDDYLKLIRPAAASADRRSRSLALVRKQDLIAPSAERQAKLSALDPVLEYLDRDTVVEVKVLRLGLAWAGFLEGAAVLVSDRAVDLLTAEELQAVVAHELGHEYFAGEYEAARNTKRYDTVKEIELRCDAISIVTMRHLGLDAAALLSAVAKLTKFNEGRGFPNNPNLVPSLEERTNFSRAVRALIEEPRATGQTAAVASPASPAIVSRVRIPDDRTRSFVRRALANARAQLVGESCRQLFSEFADSSGRPLQESLDARRQQPEEYLATLFFYDGSGLPGCRSTVAAATSPGSQVVLICGDQFDQQRWPDGEVTLIHEMLHTLGLGENPPSSSEISRQVRMRCFGHREQRESLGR